ncbi:MAG: metallophosphoesterase [Pirellulales bacterium]
MLKHHSGSYDSVGSPAILFCGIGICLAACLTDATLAHPPKLAVKTKDTAHDPHSVRLADRNDRPERAVLLPTIDGPTPWSDAPVLNSPDRFHIAIMTDRTGGHRPGIWMQGVRAVNLLRPEFVVSVGDLIEGYSENRNQVEVEWKEFLTFINQMEMKFFFVAGNHDLTNPMMHDVWRKHFGREWYSFNYQGVHFVCLNSEDPVSHVGEKQLAWLENDLNQHVDARWTLLFIHKPLWAMAAREKAAGNPDPTGWTRVESMLGSRPHTVFAGHVHHYVQFDQNGNKYYSLATTGGGSQLRGTLYGEFDHVVWLTMENDGPHVANLLLDGILPADVVTEKGLGRFRDFLAKILIEVAPIWIEEQESFSQRRIDLRVTNRFDTPIEMTGRIEGLPLSGLTLDPADLALTVPPGETVELALAVHFSKPIGLSSLAHTQLSAHVKTLGKDRPLAAEWSVPVTIDRKYDVPHRTVPATVDGRLDDWGKLRFATDPTPLVLGAADQWQGPGDASMSFDVAHDDAHVMIAGHVVDDAVVKGDAVEVWLDARPLAQRAKDRRLRGRAYSFMIYPPHNDHRGALTTKAHRSPPAPGGCHAESKQSGDGYDFELALPISLFHGDPNTHWKSAQLTLVVRDVDESGQPTARVVWRGTSDLNHVNTNYGQFVRHVKED